MTTGKLCRLGSEEPVFCHGMDGVLERDGRGTKYQGAKIMTLVNMKTGGFARHLLVLKSGQHSKKGLVMNFCPFCRSELVAGAEEEWSKATPPSPQGSAGS